MQGLNIVADAQWSIDHAQYAAAHSTGTPVTQYRYGTPAFYVPALSSYPQWFVVDVPASPQTGTAAGPAVSTLMVFVHSSKTDAMDGGRIDRARSAPPGPGPRQRRVRGQRQHHGPEPAGAAVHRGTDPGRRGRPGTHGAGRRDPGQRAADDRAVLGAGRARDRGHQGGPVLPVAARGRLIRPVGTADGRWWGPGAVRDVPEHHHRAPRRGWPGRRSRSRPASPPCSPPRTRSGCTR